MQIVSRNGSGLTSLGRMLGAGFGWHLTGVGATTRWIVNDGENPPWAPDKPMIALTWHGRHFLSNVAMRKHPKRSLLVAGHKDGQLIGEAARRWGFDIVTGSGAQTPADAVRKRGAPAFRSLLTHLKNDRAVLMSADVPKVARVAGAGPIKLAQVSGAPIYCFAALTTNRIELNNWDRMHIVMPFGQGVILWGKAIEVRRDSTADELEIARLEVESTLNALSERAERLLTPDAKPLKAPATARPAIDPGHR